MKNGGKQDVEQGRHSRLVFKTFQKLYMLNAHAAGSCTDRLSQSTIGHNQIQQQQGPPPGNLTYLLHPVLMSPGEDHQVITNRMLST